MNNNLETYVIIQRSKETQDCLHELAHFRAVSTVSSYSAAAVRERVKREV